MSITIDYTADGCGQIKLLKFEFVPSFRTRL